MHAMVYCLRLNSLFIIYTTYSKIHKYLVVSQHNKVYWGFFIFHFMDCL